MSSSDALIAFVTITHPNLADPIRVVSDVVDYVKDGHTFTGVVFEFKVVSDNEQAPHAEIKVPNVDRRVSQALRSSRERAKIQLQVCNAADFDLTVFPRIEIGSSTSIYEFAEFELADVSADVSMLTGRVVLRDYAQEPWPRITATSLRLPGMAR